MGEITPTNLVKQTTKTSNVTERESKVTTGSQPVIKHDVSEISKERNPLGDAIKSAKLELLDSMPSHLARSLSTGLSSIEGNKVVASLNNGEKVSVELLDMNDSQNPKPLEASKDEASVASFSLANGTRYGIKVNIDEKTFQHFSKFSENPMQDAAFKKQFKAKPILILSIRIGGNKPLNGVLMKTQDGGGYRIKEGLSQQADFQLPSIVLPGANKHEYSTTFSKRSTVSATEEFEGQMQQDPLVFSTAGEEPQKISINFFRGIAKYEPKTSITQTGAEIEGFKKSETSGLIIPERLNEETVSEEEPVKIESIMSAEEQVGALEIDLKPQQ